MKLIVPLDGIAAWFFPSSFSSFLLAFVCLLIKGSPVVCPILYGTVCNDIEI